jgi:hypothetical protein
MRKISGVCDVSSPIFAFTLQNSTKKADQKSFYIKDSIIVISRDVRDLNFKSHGQRFGL